MEQLGAAARARIITKALQARAIEERLLALFERGLLNGTVHTCIGQEFSAAVVAEFIQTGDWIFSSHRCHGHFIAAGGAPERLIAELMGRSTGVCGGRGGSQHLYMPGFCSNGILAGCAPIAAGRALAEKLQGRPNIAVIFLGDGALGEGVLYETFNLASKWEAPLLFVVEDNSYAQSTAKAETLAGSILKRAEAFDIRAFSGSTWDWEALYFEAQRSAAFVRGGRPALLLVETYRLRAHSKGDDNRDAAEVAAFEKQDPLSRLLAAEPGLAHTRAQFDALLDRGCEDACAAPVQPPRVECPPEPIRWVPVRLPAARVATRLNEALNRALAADPRVILIGEDIESPYGGAFKVTQDLSARYPGRVRNTPISEAAIIGMGTGLALGGYRPIVEIMFGDFLTLGFDQLLNHAAKFEDMYNGQVRVPLIVRTPMGGRRGYGPTHSQSLGGHFLGIPGLQILAVSTLVDPHLLYARLLEHSSPPTVVLEDKVQYSKLLRAEIPSGFSLFASDERYPCAWLKPEVERPDVTLLGYGGMSDMLVAAAEELFDGAEITCQILCPSRLYPFDLRPLIPLLAQSRLILCVEEGQSFAGFCSEVAAQLLEYAPETLPRFRRLGPQACSIPASFALEQQTLPTVERITEECRRALA